MTLFRLDTSFRTEGSVSRQVADTLQKAWADTHPDATVVHRDLGTQPLPADVWAASATAGFTPPEARTQAQQDATALAATLADELLAADAIVIGAPLYNFNLAQQLKIWIDLVITDPRFGAGVTAPLAGKPVTLIVARGGGYGAGTPREGWDHATPYLLRILGDVWGADVSLVAAELTLAEVNPAMAELRGVAAESLAQAHELAAATGRELAQRALATAA
ncbi:MAG: FMN-dependent NADH-azoreductase [Pseudonocardiales bacterium]|jgi:FMN-dependent NADH-azoreductase|uniref:FMN-dependent NADH-azoreductase n=1 Tax=Pseudonocardia sp. TaxID=60912 RepID=UPI002630F762|nr:NAD(P)H-dependent oxidoreductase [Pseudonocardia sp.]MCW2717434.1 phosphodiesterase [Pseudonocardia sp.]MDT7705649.1 FMN-dependent NADH-azoreductase [Pseudonocardiales bacterium]